MTGIYKITEIKTHPTKFACMVSFNGKPAHYYEVDSLDPTEISETLQKTADDDATQSSIQDDTEKQVEAIVIKDGQIVI